MSYRINFKDTEQLQCDRYLCAIATNVKESGKFVAEK